MYNVFYVAGTKIYFNGSAFGWVPVLVTPGIAFFPPSPNLSELVRTCKGAWGGMS